MFALLLAYFLVQIPFFSPLTDINLIRTVNGLEVLIEDQKLKPFCFDRLKNMKEFDYFSHINPKTGEKWSDKLQAAKLKSKYFGENLAINYESNTLRMISDWMLSPKHRENILFPDYKKTYICTDGKKVVQLFAS